MKNQGQKRIISIKAKLLGIITPIVESLGIGQKGIQSGTKHLVSAGAYQSEYGVWFRLPEFRRNQCHQCVRNLK